METISIIAAIAILVIGLYPFAKRVYEWNKRGQKIMYRRWVDGELVEDTWKQGW